MANTRHRTVRFGHKVLYFNPWGLHGLPQHRIDPLQTITKYASDPQLIGELDNKIDQVVLQLVHE